MSDPNAKKFWKEHFNKRALEKIREELKSDYGNLRSFKIRLDAILYVLKNLKNKKGKLLDIGCGPGVIASILKNLGFEVIAVDLSSNMAKITNEKGIKTIVCDAYHLPFKEETFNIVLCIEVLEYIENPTRVINEIYRVLSNKGEAVIIAPNEQCIFVALRKNIIKRRKIPAFYRRYTSEELEKYFLKFNEIEYSAIHYPIYIKNLKKKFNILDKISALSILVKARK